MDTEAQSTDPQQHTFPSTRGLVLGSKELSHVISRKVADRPKDILVTTNSSMIHRSPQVSSHHIEAGWGIVIPCRLPADVCHCGFGSSAAMAEGKSLKHARMRNTRHLHSRETANAIIMYVTESAMNRRLGYKWAGSCNWGIARVTIYFQIPFHTFSDIEFRIYVATLFRICIFQISNFRI